MWRNSCTTDPKIKWQRVALYRGHQHKGGLSCEGFKVLKAGLPIRTEQRVYGIQGHMILAQAGSRCCVCSDAKNSAKNTSSTAPAAGPGQESTDDPSAWQGLNSAASARGDDRGTSSLIWLSVRPNIEHVTPTLLTRDTVTGCCLCRN